MRRIPPASFPFLCLAIATGVACSDAGSSSGPARVGSGASAGAGNTTSGGSSGSGGGSGSGLGGSLSLDGGGDAPGITEDSACLVDRIEGEAVPAQVLFQLDKSGSMNCAVTNPGCLTGDPTPAPDDSRWDLFRTTLLDTLPALPATTSVGLMTFPSTFSCSENSLVVSFDAVTTATGSFGSALSGISPEGITPTHDAVLNGFSQLAASTFDGDRYLVLATDGQSTVCEGCDAACSFSALDADNEQMIANIATRAGEGLRSFIIGVQGSEGFRNILSRMASAGGTAQPGCSDNGPTYCHYDLTDPSLDFSQSLKDALTSVAGSVVTCEFEIPDSSGGEFDPNQLNVEITDAGGMTSQIPRDPNRGDGWDYNDDQTKVVLHGPPCEQAKSTATGSVTLLFGCPTVVR